MSLRRSGFTRELRCSGALKGRPPRAPLAATLVPNPKRGMEDTWRETGRTLATLKTAVAADGAFLFEHVRPDGYQLFIEGEDVTPLCRLVEVEDRNAEIGVLRPPGTGQIVGTIHRAGGLDEAAWPLAEVLLTAAGVRGRSQTMPRQEREGVADEDGRFAFERVPEGINCIQVNPINSQDHMQGFLWAAQVVAGETTEVRTFDRGKDRRLEVSIVVGNGSHRDFDLGSADRKPEHALLSFLRGGEPSFALELVPRSSQVCSFPADTNPGNRSNRGRIRLNDVSPGVYHLSLLDAPEYVGAEGSVLYEHDVLVRPGAPPVEIALGAAAIECTVEGGSYGLVLAIEHGSKLPPRRVHYSGDQPFAIRFVQPGTYSLVAHDEKHGWGKGPPLPVGNEIAKAAPIKLVPGGLVQGRIVARTPCPVPDAVVAVDSTGIEIRDREFGETDLMEYRIPHLWPGEWTIKLLDRGNVITSLRVKISGREAVTKDLVVTMPAAH